MLWIAGRPGCGKSVLVSNVVHHLREGLRPVEASGSYFVAYAFSDKHDEGKKSSTALLRIILWQIIASGRLSISQKAEILSDCGETSGHQARGQTASVNEGFEYVSRLLQRYVKFFSRLILVFDGIDECYDPEKLVKLLSESPNFQLDGISILVSSQKTANITEYMDGCLLSIDMEEDGVRRLTDRDIRQYIESELSNSKNLLIKDHANTVAELVTAKANGMFLWAAVAVPEVQAKADMHHDNSDQFLETVGELPENLETAFLHFLSRILQPDSSVGRRLNEQRQAVLLQILQWAFHASRPLSIDELQAALSIPDNAKAPAISMAHHQLSGLLNMDTLLKMCYPVLYVSSRVVHIMHSAFTAFVLPSDKSTQSTKATAKLGGVLSQSIFAARCLTYLSQACFKDFVQCEWGDASFKKYPFLKYAVSNWVPHTLKDPRLNASLKGQIASFLASAQAVAWLEQWFNLGIDSLKNVQSQLFGHQGYVADPQWLLKLLIHSREERCESAPLSAQTRTMMVQLGLLYKFHGLIGDSERIFRQLSEKQQQALPRDDPSLWNTMNNLAMTCSDAGKTTEAKQLYEELLSILESLSGDHVGDIISVSGNMASLYSRMGQFNKAEEMYLENVWRCLATYGTRHASTCLAYNNLGVARLALSKFASAKQDSSKAIELYTELQGEDSLDALLAMNTLASAESGMGNHEHAAEIAQHVWTQRRSLLGDTHPDTLVSGNNYASNLGELERFSEATTLLRGLLQHRKKLSGDLHPSTLTVMSNLAYMLEQQGHDDESLHWKKTCLANREASLGESHPDTLISMNNLATTYKTAYELGKAEELIVKSFKLHTATLSPKHNATLVSRDNLASLCALQNRYALAKHLAARSVVLTNAVFGDSHPDSLTRQISLASVASDMSQNDDAERVLKKILRVCSREAITQRGIIAATKIELSRTYREQGMYVKAKESALEVVNQLWHDGTKDGAERIWLSGGREQLALTLHRQGKLNEALEEIKQVVEQQQQRFGAESKATFRSQCVLASIHLDMGHAELAEKLISPIVKTWSVLLGRDHSLTGMAIDILARSCQKQKRYDEAEPLQLQAIGARQAALGPRHPLTLLMKHHYSALLWEMCEFAEAERLMCETLEEQKMVLREGHPSIDQSISVLKRFRAHRRSNASSVVLKTPDQTTIPNGAERGQESELVRTLAEAQIVLGSTDPETLLIKRELALFYKSTDRMLDAKHLLEVTLQEHLATQSACHVDTLTTLVELLDVSETPSQLKQDQFAPCLITAIQKKDLDLLQRLLDCGADISKRDTETDLSSLGFAVHRREEAMVECLLKSGADVNVLEADGSTALHRASKNGSAGIVKLLLDSGANTQMLERRDGRSPLYLACFHDRLEVVRLLLQEGANPNVIETIPPLHVATGYNRLAMVECLLEYRADIEAISSDGFTPLINAVYYGHLPAVEMLIKRGADRTFKTKTGGGPLHFACVRGWEKIVAFLLATGDDPNEPTVSDGCRPLHLATELGHLPVVDALLLAGADLDLPAQNDAAMTPLAYAARFGRADIVDRMLKEQGQTPNVQVTRLNVSPLHFAAAFGHDKVMTRLIDNGADLNAVTTAGATPLKEAVRGSHLAAVEILVAAGADATIGAPQLTALGLALINTDTKIVEALVSCRQTDLNAFIISDITPLYLAILTAPASTVKLMLDQGADPNFPNGARQITALQLAVQQQKRELIGILLASGANEFVQDVFGRTAVDWVDAGNTFFSMLNENCRTPQSNQVATTKTALVGMAKSVRHILSNGKTKADQSVRDLLDAMAVGLLLGGALHDALIALEQCIVWIDKDKKRVVEHLLMCDGCTNMDEITGPLHICRKCVTTTLCEKCMEGHASGEKRCSLCRHDYDEYARVPRPGWYAFEASGLVDMDESSGLKETMEDWLARLEKMYGD